MLLGLLVCPPLAILAFVVVVPVLGFVLVLGLLAAVLSTPYLLVHHFRGPVIGTTGRCSRIASAMPSGPFIDLLPHRIVADARREDAVR